MNNKQGQHGDYFRAYIDVAFNYHTSYKMRGQYHAPTFQPYHYFFVGFQKKREKKRKVKKK